MLIIGERPCWRGGQCSTIHPSIHVWLGSGVTDQQTNVTGNVGAPERLMHYCSLIHSPMTDEITAIHLYGLDNQCRGINSGTKMPLICAACMSRDQGPQSTGPFPASTKQVPMDRLIISSSTGWILQCCTLLYPLTSTCSNQ